MADWSFGNFTDKLGGLLSSPEQQMALLSSPMFGAGMGLLSSSYNPQINPFQAAVQGIQSAKQQTQADEDRKRIEEQRQELYALIQQIADQQRQAMNPRGMMLPDYRPGGTNMSPVSPQNLPFGVNPIFSGT